MKNHQIYIIWICSVLVVFLVGYFNAVTSPFAPLSGTVGLDGYKISYRFDKKITVDSTTRFIVRSEHPNPSGYLRFLQPFDTLGNRLLRKDRKMLVAVLPTLPIGTLLKYEAVIFSETDTIVVPAKGFEGSLFIGKVPKQLSTTLHALLFLGLLFAMRATLETTRTIPHLRRYTLFALVAFTTYGIILEPLVNTYLLGAVAKRILQPNEIFSVFGISLSVLWIVASVLIFKRLYDRYMVYVATLLSFLLFIVMFKP